MLLDQANRKHKIRLVRSCQVYDHTRVRVRVREKVEKRK